MPTANKLLTELIDNTNSRITVPSGGINYYNNQITVPSNGINFGTSTDGTGTVTSGVMDDYEEGTFQPSYDATITAPTVGSYGFRYGFYTKISNLVHINLAMRANISSVGSGSAIISGLPFPVNSTLYQTNAFAVGYYENWTTNGPTIAIGITDTDEIHLYRDNGASGTRITVSNYKTGGATYNEIYIAGTYRTN